MMLNCLHRFVLPAAYDVLPAKMQSPAASAMLLAIALQESKCAHRKQVNGPARGLWQFELSGGVVGVRSHPATRPHLQVALASLCYPALLQPSSALLAIEHNDIVGCVFARLLLWSLPDALPTAAQPGDGWRQYLEAWRPGKPHPETWPANFARAWTLIHGETSHAS
jgi:hypothetical protein